MAVHCFVGRDDQPNVKGLVFAGLADLKSELNTPKILDKRLLAKVLKLVDTSYGMEKGLHQAIALSADVIGEVRLLKEQRLLERYFHELVGSASSEGRAACGLRETMLAFSEGVVDTLLCWEQLPVERYTVQHSLTGKTQVIYHSKRSGAQGPAVRELTENHPATKADPQHWSVVEQVPLIDWLAEHYREFGAQLAFVSGNSESGNQFVQSFGGLGAVLRYRIDFESLMGENELASVIEDELNDDDDFCLAEEEQELKSPEESGEVLEFDESEFEDDNGSEDEASSGSSSPTDKGKDKVVNGSVNGVSKIKYTDKIFEPRAQSGPKP